MSKKKYTWDEVCRIVANLKSANEIAERWVQSLVRKGQEKNLPTITCKKNTSGDA